MTRKEFLQTIWKRYLRPAILGLLLVFAINFLIEVIRTSGPERQSLIALLVVSAVVALIIGLQFVLAILSVWLSSMVPESLKYALDRTFRVLNFLAPFVTVWLIYQMYMTGNYAAAGVAGIYLFHEIWPAQSAKKKV